MGSFNVPFTGGINKARISIGEGINMCKIVSSWVVLAILSAASQCLAQGATATSTTTAPASPNSPTTMPASAPRVAEIRALVKDAIALKSDPNQAQAMMVRACELTAKLPPGSDLKTLIIEFDPAKGEMNHLMRPTSTEVLDEKKHVSPHIELCEKFASNTYPFSGMVDNGKGFIFPTPMTDKVLKEQSLQREGRVIFSVVSDPRKETRWKEYYVSPDEKFVVLQDSQRARPIEVLSVDTGKTVAVEAPKIYGHHYIHPFGFFKWDSDSKSFIVEISGTYVKGPGQFLAYRELWQVDPGSGKAKQVKRQEQPWAEKMKWDD